MIKKCCPPNFIVRIRVLNLYVANRVRGRKKTAPYAFLLFSVRSSGSQVYC